MEKFIVGIDLGGTNLKLALLNSNCKIKEKRVLSTKEFHKKEELIGAITDSVSLILTDHSLRKAQVQGVGLGLPGPIDTQRGVVHFFPNIPGWKEVALRKILEQKLKLPVFIDNDANLMSLAESRLGVASGFKNVVCLTLGTGVGGGVIINKQLFRGSSFSAGEIGHIPLNESGPRCKCGREACLEAYIGNNVILKNAKRVFKSNISLEELSVLANRGNKKAREIWKDVGSHLGVALAGIVNLLNPDAIVIGGGVASAGKILFNQIRKTVSLRAMSVPVKNLKIFKATLGNDAGLIGAAILVKESLS